MGEVKAEVVLENFVDRIRAQENGAVQVRSFKTQALVDSGALMSMLPHDVVEYLGLPIRDKVIVTLANQDREEMEVAEGLTIKIAGRSTTLPCLVGPPRCEPLIGQVVLEVLDLLVDCPNQRIIPNPESPVYPSLKLK